MNFRYDINAMRALAVTGVVFFHFGFSTVSNGFAGVDVFFVISGYLMTRIIFNKLEQNTFTLKSFYIDRIRRIIPALIVVCFVVMLVGYLIMGADIYRLLAKHVKYSLRFMSNIAYLRESGYFDNASQEKWLLHTWSLSVEWQFYILYPLFILALKRFITLNKIKIVLVVFTLLSFLLCIYYSYADQSKAFYLLLTRAWEMLAGGLIYLYPVRLRTNYSRYLSVLGIIIIIGSFVSNLSMSRWPGYYTLAPVIGSALVVLANNNTFAVFKNSILQFLGKTSYSLYLWHWPIYALLYYFEVNGELSFIILGLAASLLLAFLSYVLIEMPFANKNNRRLFWPLIAAFVVCYSISALIVNKDGLPNRFNDGRMISYDINKNKSRYQDRCMPHTGIFESWCFIDESKPVDIIAIGDSHSDAIITAISEGLGKNVKFISYAGCLTIPGLKRWDMGSGYQCGEFSRQLLADIKTISPDIPLVMTNRLSGYFPVGDAKPVVYFDKQYNKPEQAFYDELTRNYLAMVCELAQSRPVYIVLPFPEMKMNVPKVAIKNNILKINQKEVYITLDEYKERHKRATELIEKARDECGIAILDPTPYLCRDGKCQGIHKGVPVYYDDSHLSEYGNKLLIPMFSQIWAER